MTVKVNHSFENSELLIKEIQISRKREFSLAREISTEEQLGSIRRLASKCQPGTEPLFSQC